MNSLLNAQICPVRFKGRPPNSFDQKSQKLKKDKLTINDFKNIFVFIN